MAFLDRLAAYGDRVRVAPQDETGLLDLATYLGAPAEDTLVYCCGPEPLLDAVEERCRAWPSGALRVERFRPREPDPSGVDLPSASFELVLGRSGRALTVRAGVSVLEAVEEAGVQVLSSCREGTCGTCETDVLEGTPDHRDSLLTEDERAAGETMMICVSRCLGPKLVLDL
jgi:ferredoxin